MPDGYWAVKESVALEVAFAPGVPPMYRPWKSVVGLVGAEVE